MKRPIALALFVLAGSFGCTQSEDDACAKNEVFDNGSCKPKPAGMAGSSGDAGASAQPSEGGSGSGQEGGAPGAGNGDAGAPTDVAFGAPCDTHADCGGETDYCAKSPVAPPYCTAQGCDENADICPEDWACFDVSQFAPGEPWICMQPTM